MHIVTFIYIVIAFENKFKVRLFIQATTALAETTAIADFRGLTVFSAIYVVHCIAEKVTCCSRRTIGPLVSFESLLARESSESFRTILTGRSNRSCGTG